ncbi:MAG: hypothetical protein AAFN41_03800 [Planctomycetota bacterium]
MAGRRTTISGLVIAALLAVGCRSTVATQGYHGVRATWSPPVLSATLDDPIRATDVAAAAEVALRRMGYTITERHSSMDRGTVTALAPGGTRADRIVVKAEPDVRDMRVEIITRARPDEDRARVILDEMLVLLGQ